MTPLRLRLTRIVGDAFDAEGLPRDLAIVTRSDRPDLAQFQCNGAMAAGKIAKTSPRDIAGKVVRRLSDHDIFADLSVAGPGFINLNLTRAVLNAHADELLSDAHFGAIGDVKKSAEKIVLDFGGPNIAKPMHVGHLRSTIIGDCLQRLVKLVGHTAISDVHMGDWGKPIGMLIVELKLAQPDLPYFDPNHSGSYPADSPVTMAELEQLYPKAAQACKTDQRRDEEAREAIAALQRGRPGYRALWQHFVTVSKAGMEREFAALHVHFDLWKGESDVDQAIRPMVDDLLDRGVAEIDDGAVIVRVAEPDDQQEIPPLMCLKRDGAATYGATDLATIIDRVRSASPDRILYVVDQRQHTHFLQVFRAAEKAGFVKDTALEHIGFGTMNGPDGKPFKTREGGVMKLHDLIENMKDKAQERLAEAGLAGGYPEQEREKIAAQVAMAALKFADLSNHRLSDYIFDFDRFVRFEGKTGPYLQYAAVRIQSILRKAQDDNLLIDHGPISLQSPVEDELVLCASQFPDAIEAAYQKRAPNILCDHAYGLAQVFSRFYNEHHILSESNQALRGSRLALCRLALGQLTTTLDVLGIELPNRM